MDISGIQTICAIISAFGVIVSLPSALISINQLRKNKKLKDDIRKMNNDTKKLNDDTKTMKEQIEKYRNDLIMTDALVNTINPAIDKIDLLMKKFKKYSCICKKMILDMIEKKNYLNME